jgi:hypothetical protein
VGVGVGPSSSRVVTSSEWEWELVCLANIPRGHVFDMFQICLSNRSQTFFCFRKHFHVYKPIGIGPRRNLQNMKMFGKCVKISRERNFSGFYQKKSETHVFLCMFLSAKNGPKNWEKVNLSIRQSTVDCSP